MANTSFSEHAEFDLHAVKEFMLCNGGRVKNHQLVNYFRRFLNDPRFKAVNREKFKDFVNELSTIKVEEGEKILVLKKKYRQDYDSLSTSSSSNDVRAQSEPPTKSPAKLTTRDEMDGGGMSKVRSESSLDKPFPAAAKSVDSASVNSLAMSTTSVASTESRASVDSGQSSQASLEEEDPNSSVFSVKERAKQLNRMESDSGLVNVPSPGRRKELKSVRGVQDDDESHSSGASYVTLEPEEREWMLTCCHSEYQDMFKLLSKNPSLAKLKDFTNTALHWAAKNGKPEVIKLIASKSGINVNHKSGYTALHMAAIHGHEDIIELLIQGYKADANLRDFSGKKAKQYLKNSASSRTQQLLLSRRLASNIGSGRSLDDSFLRSTSFRKSNRARAITSMIQASSSHYMRQPVLSWTGGSTEDLHKTPDSTPPGSSGSSPAMSRKLTSQSFRYPDKHLMPPPHAPTRRKKVHTSSSHETLDTFSEFDNKSCTLSKSGSDPALATKKQTFI